MKSPPTRTIRVRMKVGDAEIDIAGKSDDVSVIVDGWFAQVKASREGYFAQCDASRKRTEPALLVDVERLAPAVSPGTNKE